MATQRKVYQEIAGLLQAIENCEKTGNHEWQARHGDRLKTIIDNCLPSGSGIDTGTKLGDASGPERLVFEFSYHHMNEGGFYDGWTDHRAIVTPSLLSGYDIRITGRDRNGIKDHLSETFHHCLGQTLTGQNVVTDEMYAARKAYQASQASEGGAQ